MEKILEKIIEADCEAKKKVSVQKDRLDKINYEIIAEKKLIDEKLREQAESTIKNTKITAENDFKEKTLNIDNYFSKTADNLKSSYDSNHEKWADQIFNEIIK